MLRAIASAAITLGLLGTQATSAREETPKRYIETPTGYLVVAPRRRRRLREPRGPGSSREHPERQHHRHRLPAQSHVRIF